jgi:hypothetical protein
MRLIFLILTASACLAGEWVALEVEATGYC